MAILGGGPSNPGRGMRFFPAFAAGIITTAPVLAAPDLGVLVLAGFAPAVQTPRTVAPAVGQLTLSGFAPTVTISVLRTPGTGVLTLTGFAPAVSTPRVVRPALGVLTLTGFVPTVTAMSGTTATPGRGQLLLSGFAPTVTGTPARPGAGIRRSRAVYRAPRPTELPRPTPKHRLELEPSEPPLVCQPPPGRSGWIGYRPIVFVSDLALERLALRLALNDPDLDAVLTLGDRWLN